MPVLRRLDLSKYPEEIARQFVQRIAIEIRAKAKELCRKDTWELHNSIRADFVKNGRRAEISSNVPHGPAQEFGRPDLPRYGFTPHMRPAAKYAVENLDRFADEVIEQARRDSRI
jgi:hypothetical protein